MIKETLVPPAALPAGRSVLQPRIGFIGFGEVTSYLIKGLRSEGLVDLTVYSRSVNDRERRQLCKVRAAELGGRIADDWPDLVASSDVIFSSVQGHVALETAETASRFIRPGQLFVDLNNAIPAVKRTAAQAIARSGGKFVDVGLLELPIQREHRALMYASGRDAPEFKALLEPFGMNIRVVDGPVGQAATIKALANIFMKGLQGVCLEFAIGARRAGVSLKDMEPLLVKPVVDLPREKDAGFWIIRGSLLAERKKHEMNEALRMMQDLGVDPLMLTAAVERLNRVSGLRLNEFFDAAMPVSEYGGIIEKMFEIGAATGREIR